ncbi:hypothetical protein Pla123a_36860 [Posidoniimonas polymericola]|uniref:DUF202 domain-containing protein n=1 Tax=Posidoniimonas polymericola TaxID=2528002 RepID=A0A5C5YHZ5_9BACT|nr:DUF202 domain-containing protein [Posidoniimonas polymericola]TWT73792.1 hypothetical protein Pla123a_36860 [Posidoniimonas polymericola]
MDPSATPLRDTLAVERTRLANERTLLAYVRTAIMLAATGATLVTLYDDMPTRVVTGWTLILAGAVVGGVGFGRFRRVGRRLAGS